MPRLALATTTCRAIPILLLLAFIRWRNDRLELSTWRRSFGLAAMFIVFALWLIQAVCWGAIADHREFGSLLAPNWTEVEMFLPAFYAYPALPLALVLKGSSRLQTVVAWFLLAVFYGTFGYT